MPIKTSRPGNRWDVSRITFWLTYLVGLAGFAGLTVHLDNRSAILGLFVAVCWSVTGWVSGYRSGHAGGYLHGFRDACCPAKEG